jgi:cellulose synthase/poly-beta-1,6-N-acetylglucosamine synthase-like glycosyltransferase
MHPKPSDGKLARSRIAIVVTVLAWLAYVVSTVLRQYLDYGNHGFRFTMESIGYVVIVTLLTFSALMYLVARTGAFQRFQSHTRVPRAELERHFAENPTGITVLVPSYAEEPEVVRATLLSAALQEFPELRVVLLLDDDPAPKSQAAADRLARTHEAVAGIERLLAEPAEHVDRAVRQFTDRIAADRRANALASAEEASRLAREYYWAAGWLHGQAIDEKNEDHVDEFFVSEVLMRLAEELMETGDALHAASVEGARLPIARLDELYRRLQWTFTAELSVFQRKAWASLSHEANKAMNLNAYIGLMGGRYRAIETPMGRSLIEAGPLDEDAFDVPDSEFVLTLDADSILLREYCLRLVYFLQQPGNERVAVTQTPYSSFRGAPTRLERLAAATTDVQHILHQGMTHFGATFWVGANAVIRRAALDDIREIEHVDGVEVRRFIQDRTVIEDTESSVDLAVHGWTLANYPERLSYSATPSDFGSLVVQRRRWANGGLLILPKLFSQRRELKRRGKKVPATEFLLRLNYMASIAWASFGLLFMLAYPYDSRLLSPFVMLAALPYFAAMASDLHYSGYKRTDVFRIYAFNLILLPVNLAGVLKSIQQAVTAKKIPFARTPKVKNRTATPFLYVIAPAAIVAFSVLTLWRDWYAQNWANAAFALVNAVFASYAIVAFIGIGPMFADAWAGATRWMYVPRTQTETNEATTADAAGESKPTGGTDWRLVLYRGAGEVGDARRPAPIAFETEFAAEVDSHEAHHERQAA